MGKGKTIELTITPNYVSDWDFCDAVRELIQNGIDQQTLDPANEFEMTYDSSEETLQLKNATSSLEINTLLLGCSTKSDNSDTVGQFGEGYKIAALVLNRIGKTFTVYNNSKDELWVSKFETSSVFGEKVLAFSIYEQQTDEEGIVIEIENVSEEEYESLNDVWLGMSGSIEYGKIETEYGEILTDEEMSGKFFVNGLAVESKTNKHFGYNFKPKYITLERDRKSCNRWDVSRVTGDMICEAMNTGKLDVKEVMRLAEENGFNDLSNLQYKTWDSEVKKFSKMLIDEFDSENIDCIPVGSQSDYDNVKQLGGKPIFVPYNISTIISDETTKRIEELASVTWSGDFTVGQKLRQWIDFYGNDLPEDAVNQFNKIIENLE